MNRFYGEKSNGHGLAPWLGSNREINLSNRVMPGLEDSRTIPPRGVDEL